MSDKENAFLGALGVGVVASIIVSVASLFVSFEKPIRDMGFVKGEDIESAIRQLRDDLEPQIFSLEEDLEKKTDLAEFEREMGALAAKSDTSVQEARDSFLEARIKLRKEMEEELRTIAKATKYFGTNVHVKYYEETAKNKAIVELPNARAAVALITAYAEGSANGRARPVNLAVDIKIDGSTCGRTQDIIDKKEELELFVSASCIQDLAARSVPYKVEALSYGTNSIKRQLKLRYAILQEAIPEE